MKVYVLVCHNTCDGLGVDTVVYLNYEDAKQAWKEARQDALDCEIDFMDDDESSLYLSWDVNGVYSEIYVEKKHVWRTSKEV